MVSFRQTNKTNKNMKVITAGALIGLSQIGSGNQNQKKLRTVPAKYSTD